MAERASVQLFFWCSGMLRCLVSSYSTMMNHDDVEPALLLERAFVSVGVLRETHMTIFGPVRKAWISKSLQCEMNDESVWKNYLPCFSRRHVFSGGHMLQGSLNTNFVTRVVGATTPLPMDFSRRKDDGLDGWLEFGREHVVYSLYWLEFPY